MQLCLFLTEYLRKSHSLTQLLAIVLRSKFPMAAKTAVFLLLCPFLSWAAADCANPLFSKERWPSTYPRPSYLPAPEAFQQEDPPRCPEVDPGASCCNSNTTMGIGDDYVLYVGMMYDWSADVSGVVQDAFNDFNPVVQQQMRDFGWSESGSSASGSSASQGSSTSTITNDGSSNTIDQSIIDAAFSSEPVAGVPDSYASIEVTSGDYVSFDNWSYGRAKQRLRSGLLKLSDTTQTEVRHKANDMNGYMMQLSYYNYQCQQMFRQHMVGMLCLGCQADYANWVSLKEGVVQVLLSTEACDSLYDACKSFLKLYQDLPPLVSAMTAAMKSTILADPAYSQVSASIQLSDLDSLLVAPSATLCQDKSSCKTYLCTNLVNGVGGIFPNKKLLSDPANLLGSQRRLEASVSYVVDSSGFDSVTAGKGENTIIMPLLAAADGASGAESAPFGDSLNWSCSLSLSLASLYLALC